MAYKDPTKRKAYLKAWAAARPGYGSSKRRERLARAAGREPGACCEICGTVFERVGHWTKLPVYDHDHVTGEFRGWLCNACNVGLGRFQDDPGLLVRAAQYLKDTK